MYFMIMNKSVNFFQEVKTPQSMLLIPVYNEDPKPRLNFFL
ncbi:MAG: hypothetical protein NZ529_10370 [Cytophagaceae bacterium]|nr:hypothetical protein [Cytophagaceae bacterium]MDW8457190.1 hypothetical protein [Cytophagaceae bacterium]